jgi:hypothetical protein
MISNRLEQRGPGHFLVLSSACFSLDFWYDTVYINSLPEPAMDGPISLVSTPDLIDQITEKRHRGRCRIRRPEWPAAIRKIAR